MTRRKVALITGSAKGLGRKTAIELAEQGCDVIVNYVHSESEAQQLCGELRSLGSECMAVKADVSSRLELLSMLEAAEGRFGGIDILVNNAGPFIRDRMLFADYEWNDIEYLIQGNLLGVMALDHMVLPWMRKSRWGRIIHFGFGNAGEARSWPHRAAYAAAKTGLVSFTKTLAEEEAPNGITVNMICPGDIRGAYKEKAIEEVRGHSDPEFPDRRPGTGEDIARVISFLCSDNSDYITGNVIDITGGFNPIQSMSTMKGGAKA
jgi:3-oxoacyl-[acyl-carrier protein] reductase